MKPLDLPKDALQALGEHARMGGRLRLVCYEAPVGGPTPDALHAEVAAALSQGLTPGFRAHPQGQPLEVEAFLGPACDSRRLLRPVDEPPPPAAAPGLGYAFAHPPGGLWSDEGGVRRPAGTPELDELFEALVTSALDGLRRADIREWASAPSPGPWGPFLWTVWLPDAGRLIGVVASTQL